MPRERPRKRISTPPDAQPPPSSAEPGEPAAPAQTPHDGLFHFTFSQVEHAAPALQAVLPASLAAQIDFSTLRVERGHFVDPKLHERRADLLYSATVGKREALIYLLFEHQSYVDGMLLLRLMEYMTRIWRAWLKEHPTATRLPLLVPVVLHHSRTGWTAPRRFEELLDIDQALRAAMGELIPRFGFVLDDISHADEDDLAQRPITPLGRVVIQLFQSSWMQAALLDRIGRWSVDLRAVAAPPNGPDAMLAIMEYLHSVTRKNRAEVVMAMREALGADVADRIIHVKEYIREE
ncbi:MAG TPA: Rpn family recombination-promoting nuclease/putative transposase, partial [Candidatus Nanopelagicales bacterium]|nr:Rpn family recombination-promoting nuclease/putative transposase [Candidatus Nanopelagicales bacterium]